MAGSVLAVNERKIHFRLESVIHHISLNFAQLLKVKKISGSVIANGMNLGFRMRCVGMRIGAGAIPCFGLY